MTLTPIHNPYVRKYGWYFKPAVDQNGRELWVWNSDKMLTNIKALLNDHCPNSNWVIKAPTNHGAEYKLYADDETVGVLLKLIT